MNKYIFTFGVGSAMKHKFQPIIAANEEEARKLMVSVYGDKWSSCYTEEYFEMCRQEGSFKNVVALPTIKQEVA